MSLIEFRNVWKQYGDQVVLEKINLSVKEGEFCTLVGASGCGKSTFLKMLLGQETASRGEVLLDGKPLPAEPDRNRGVVFQKYSVFPHLTVRQNVLLGLELERSKWLSFLLGSARREALEVVDEMLHCVGLTASRDKYPHELSGGMQQRLAIAQSLVMKPRILLLDEPFGALDPGIRADMHDLMLRLWQESRITVFMVTHDLREGFHLGTRLLVFDKLRLDPQAPGAYGASITYDLPITKDRKVYQKQIEDRIGKTAAAREAA